jgi:hypothetical protein
VAFMNNQFALDHSQLRASPAYSAMAQQLDAFAPINSQATFNRYCQTACDLWNQHTAKLEHNYLRYSNLLQQIEQREGEIIATNWGGVVIIKHQHPQVEKYLVIKKGGYLALETHAEKQEQLQVEEGAGLLLWRQQQNQPLRAELLIPGARFSFSPGMEHCIIGTEDLLILEHSQDYKGMDQDLIFIFTPEPSTIGNK